MASIEQRGGSWSVYWRSNGRTGKQRVTVGPNEELARRCLELVNARRNRITAEQAEEILGIEPDRPDDDLPGGLAPSIDEIAQAWLASRTRIGGRHRADTRRKLDRVLLPALHPLSIDQVRGSHISATLRHLQQVPLKNATVDRYYVVLLSLFRFAVTEGHIGRSPVADCDWVPNLRAETDVDEDDSAGHVYLTRAQFRAFRAGFSGCDRALVDFLAGTGARWSEATALQVRDLHLTGREPSVMIRRAWKRQEDGTWYVGTTKGRRKRRVHLGVHLVKVLAELSEGADPQSLVFRAPRGGRIDYPKWRRSRWDGHAAAMRRCPEHPPPSAGGHMGVARSLRPDEVSTCDCPGVLRGGPLTPHDLRHSYTAWQVAAGEPLLAVSKALGHGSVAVTEQVYAGILPEVRRSLADVIDVVFGEDA